MKVRQILFTLGCVVSFYALMQTSAFAVQLQNCQQTLGIWKGKLITSSGTLNTVVHITKAEPVDYKYDKDGLLDYYRLTGTWTVTGAWNAVPFISLPQITTQNSLCHELLLRGSEDDTHFVNLIRIWVKHNNKYSSLIIEKTKHDSPSDPLKVSSGFINGMDGKSITGGSLDSK